jgi:hypothetical protein
MNQPPPAAIKHDHAVVWIDHKEARVFLFDAGVAEELHLHPQHAARHIHHKANSVGSGHAPQDASFYRDVAASVRFARAVLVAGPGSAKLEFVKSIERDEPRLRDRIDAVESMDHPTDGDLLAYARKHFRASDRMRLQHR